MSNLQERLESTTLAQFQARIIEKSALFMGVFVLSTREDKLRWQPSIDDSSKTRSVLEQIGECIFANIRFKHIFLGEPLPEPPANWDTFSTAEEAVNQLNSSAKELADIIRTLDAAALAREYMTHRGPMPGALAMQFPARNMTYHMGQINMIQLLYGDTVFHIDEEFTSL